MTQCDSTFFGVRCQRIAGHHGAHHAFDSPSTHETYWDEPAADKATA